MDFLEKYSLLIVTIVLSFVLLIMVVRQCFNKNKLEKTKLTLSLVNIFILGLSFLFYEKYIVTSEIAMMIYYGYIGVIFFVFAIIHSLLHL